MKYRVFEVIDLKLQGQPFLLKAVNDTAAVALAERFLNGQLQIWHGRRFVGAIESPGPSDQHNRTESGIAFSERSAQ